MVEKRDGRLVVKMLTAIFWEVEATLPESCPECGAAPGVIGFDCYEAGVARVEYDGDGKPVNSELPDVAEGPTHRVCCWECGHEFALGETLNINDPKHIKNLTELLLVLADSKEEMTA